MDYQQLKNNRIKTNNQWVSRLELELLDNLDTAFRQWETQADLHFGRGETTFISRSEQWQTVCRILYELPQPHNNQWSRVVLGKLLEVFPDLLLKITFVLDKGDLGDNEWYYLRTRVVDPTPWYTRWWTVCKDFLNKLWF